VVDPAPPAPARPPRRAPPRPLPRLRGYWAVEAGAPTAESGAWEPGPGRALFEAARAALGGLPFVAEDLGVITEDVVELRHGLGLPGMRVPPVRSPRSGERPRAAPPVARRRRLHGDPRQRHDARLVRNTG
jgi:hypothetical protein